MELFKMLREDPELYYAYQANIAMAFKDNMDWAATKVECGEDNVSYTVSREQLHTIANDAAKYFLNLLIKE